jgi:lysophospholipid acyltransferase (LPLAT)-like uncharacterized protein
VKRRAFTPPRLLVRLLARLYRALHATLRVDAFLADGSRTTPRDYPFGPEVFALSERDTLALGGILASGRFTTLVAPGRDGDWATEVATALGGRVVRGATERGGARALTSLLRDLPGDGGPLALVVDGPLGPAGVAKAGAVICAARTGRPLRPVAAAARRELVLGSTWSRLWMPLPFSRVVVVVGEPLPFASAPGREAREGLARELSSRLALARERARAEAAA